MIYFFKTLISWDSKMFIWDISLQLNGSKVFSRGNHLTKWGIVQQTTFDYWRVVNSRWSMDLIGSSVSQSSQKYPKMGEGELVV